MNTKDLPFTDMETAFLWTTVLMIGSPIAVYLTMWRLGIFQFR
jgi:zinc transporter